MLIRDAQMDGEHRDLRIDAGLIAEMAPQITARAGEEIVDARGMALLPGLHDHHIHLLSLAASLQSVRCGPPHVETEADLRQALQQAEVTGNASGSDWIRGTGYFESVAGPLDRTVLDRLAPDRPVRIQHRSGVAWFLNSRAIEALGLDRSGQLDTPPGAERGADGRATGRLFRLDDWLREALPPRLSIDLAPASRLLARFGVTGVTDATPTNGPSEAAFFEDAQSTGALSQHILLMGDRSLETTSPRGRIDIGAHKIMLDDASLPELSDLTQRIRGAHDAGRAVAIHTVTRSEILFALAALETAGPLEGDRLEHASVSPPEAVETVRRLGLRIVTQPHFVAERGDAYLREVDAIDQDLLYRLADWHHQAVELGGGTDAPFGEPDPWRAMQAAVDRQTASGASLGRSQALTPEQALALFLGEPDHPGGTPRRIMPGGPADLCLLDRTWERAREQLSAVQVRLTLIAGKTVWRAP